jgi:hypothetical protein
MWGMNESGVNAQGKPYTTMLFFNGGMGANFWEPGLRSPPANRDLARIPGASPSKHSWLGNQLTNGRPAAFAQLDEELDRPNPIFV